MMKIPDLNAIRDWCLGKFAKKEDIPQRLSDLKNDKGFLTEIPAATQSHIGAVKPDGTTIVISADGTISAVGGGTRNSGPVQLLEEPVNGLGLQFVSPEDILEMEDED